MEYYLLLNRNELLTAAWMTPQRIMSTETTQSPHVNYAPHVNYGMTPFPGRA